MADKTRRKEDLREALKRIDHRGYPAYKDLRGSYDFGDFVLVVDHVQGDPFAAPSRVRVRVAHEKASFPPETYRGRPREVALRDFLTRRFHDAISEVCKGRRGSGKSGLIAIDRPGQEIIERTSAIIGKDFIEARFVMGLPAVGRSVAGREAEAMFLGEVPAIVKRSLFYGSLDRASLMKHIETAEDADYLRGRLRPLGIVSFIADGSVLPRRSGIDQRPLRGEHLVPFQSPETLRVGVELPNRGKITGMGIPGGVTLVVGGGFHGKTTVLNAVELGVYNHIPGDGREFVVTDESAVKIRAEDGRRIEAVDISPFISNLPFGKDTVSFSTDDASGSTSQAANIIEALEAGAETLLIDEDTSATNFMIRDHRMQELVAKSREPITPFIDKIRQLYRDHGVSTILVVGGSGDYFDVADHVICMDEYRPVDVTQEARAIAERYRSERKREGGEGFGAITERCPVKEGIDPSKGRREVRISSRGLQSISFGVHHIDLGAVEQLVDPSQTRAIGEAIHYATRFMDGQRSLREVIDLVLSDIASHGLDALAPYPVGDHAVFRKFELASALNRLRTLKAVQRLRRPASS